MWAPPSPGDTLTVTIIDSETPRLHPSNSRQGAYIHNPLAANPRLSRDFIRL